VDKSISFRCSSFILSHLTKRKLSCCHVLNIQNIYMYTILKCWTAVKRRGSVCHISQLHTQNCGHFEGLDVSRGQW
jgi:hypothetical protein